MSPHEVHAGAQPAWRELDLFYQQIEGFTFEPGFRYQLEVRTEQLTDVPADASSVRYQLIKVVSKEAAR